MTNKLNKLSKRGHPLSDYHGTNLILDSVHGAARSWTLDASTLSRCVKEVEVQMKEDGLAKSSMIGTRVSISSAGPSSKSYRYSVIGSYVVLKFTRTGWRVILAQRATRYPRQKEEVSISVTSVAFEKMKNALSRRYRVRPLVEGKVPSAVNDN
ncbi:hypothetical protein [Rhizobium leguminosarum]|uniref:hypothetical protein n=1 Tax=Rhizobium leguminosarum TaxID=384 RepID=UPI003F9BA7BD